MWSRNQRQSAVHIFVRRLALLAMFVLIVGASTGVWGVYEKEKESRTLRDQTERERAELSAREAQLAGDINRLNTDRGMEEALREQYALAAEGEKLIVIVEPPEPEPTQATSTVLQKIRDFFWFW